MSRNEKVKEFMQKHKFLMGIPLPESESVLQDIGWHLIELSMDIELLDEHRVRAHLLLEELGEFLLAVGEGNKVKALDGLTDLAYVVEGAAILYDLPLEEAFNEVHRSNMTKAVSGDLRIKDKGGEFEPPNLERLIDEV